MREQFHMPIHNNNSLWNQNRLFEFNNVVKTFNNVVETFIDVLLKHCKL